MELRRCNLHYINAIKFGSIVKVSNVTRGRPGLKFKKLLDIFESEDAKNRTSSTPPICFKAVFRCCEDNIQPKSEPAEFDWNNGCSDESDFGFGNITLEQIREKCKGKKRKRSCNVNSSGVIVQTNLVIDYVDVDVDLTLPLSNWKNKRCKKTKHTNNISSGLSRFAVAGVKSEADIPSCEIFLQSDGSVDTKVEVLGVNCDSQVMVCDSFITSQSLDGQTGLSSEVPETGGNRHELATCSLVMYTEEAQKSSVNDKSHEPSEDASPDLTLPTSLSEESTKESQCPLNEDSHEFKEHLEPNSLNCVLATSLSVEITKEPQSYSIKSEKHLEIDCVLPPSLTEESTKESQDPMNEDSHSTEEHTEPDSTNCLPPTSLSGGSRNECLSTVNDDSLVSEELLKYYWENCILSSESTKGPQSPMNEDSLGSENLDFRIHDNLFGNSSMNEMPFQNSSGNNHQLASTSFSDSLQCLEYIDGISNDLPSKFVAGDFIISDDCRTSCNFDICSIPNDCPSSVSCDSPSTEDMKQFQSSTLADTTEKLCSSTIDPHDHPDEEMKLSEVDHDQHSKPQQSPERLLSTRKAISPTSQEQLCKAMGSVQLTWNGLDKCKGKLKFCKPKQIRRAEVGTNHKHSIRKPKYKDVCHQKAIFKGPHHISGTSTSSPGGSSTQSCSQIAIKFSERQMQDIECLADRLTKEMNSMTEIMKDAVYFEANSTAALKQNVDKVRVAMENVIKLEESTKKYLSVMARDCSRFCKIMKLSDEDSAAAPATSNSVTPKERRKIIFADEAGKRLCHVKIIDEETPILMESSDGNHEMLIR
ncbi:hypothetical protein ACFE04_005421 [Oxalis oulophora]